MALVSMRKTPFATGMPQTTAQSDTVAADYPKLIDTARAPASKLLQRSGSVCSFVSSSSRRSSAQEPGITLESVGTGTPGNASAKNLSENGACRDQEAMTQFG
jgi:hypothetical protein